MKDCRTPMSCCDPHCCCDIIHKPTDTVTAVLNGQPIAITGEAATVIKQKNADIADLVAGLKEHERLMCLAIKHCPKDHHDWKEILELTTSLSLNAPLAQGVVISRECAEALSAFFPDDSFTATPLRDSINELQAALGDSK